MTIAAPILTPSAENIAQLSAHFLGGGIAALPSETVYGLAGDATNSAAIARIFAAKERPHFNPLISHYATQRAMEQDVVLDDRAVALAEAFWPGPLTLILSQRPDSRLASLTTAGLSSAAVRVPAHPVMQAVLSTLPFALAAPSANPSGRLSPTTALHVQQLMGKRIPFILDGGACRQGVESTIIDLTTPQATLLRFGPLTRETIESVIGTLACCHIHDESDAPKAPGMSLSHYAPHTPLRLSTFSPIAEEALLGFGNIAHLQDHFGFVMNLSPRGDLLEASRNLFDYLHQLDARHPRRIAVSPIPNEGLGYAINDRLQRAAAGSATSDSHA